MRVKRNWIIVLTFAIVFMVSPSVQASIIINEIFADPALGLSGDANGDGVRSGSHDEFFEILNFSDSEIDISGWLFADSVSTRHVFSENTILSPYTFLAVFGGGLPQLPDINWQTASSGSLGLNNAGDTVSLFDSGTQLIDRIIYGGIGGHDQSITRFPDGVGLDFVLHSSLEDAQGALFSPGTSVGGELSLVFGGGEDPPGNAVVPEPSTLLCFCLGWGSLLFRKR